jgi:Ser/Thr protein kinase RdoA (MazF antagonist)
MSFNELTPDGIIPVVEEHIGNLLTGYTAKFSSYINRVYELRTKDGLKLIAKFYRPNRWSRDAILDEHRFLYDCYEDEIPVVVPMQLKNGSTIGVFNNTFFAIFPKKAGRQFEINDFEIWVRLGSLVGRMHCTGAKAKAESRVVIDPCMSTASDCKYLCDNVLPSKFCQQYRSLCNKLIETASPLFKNTEKIRIHGDLHSGNILDRMD